MGVDDCGGDESIFGCLNSRIVLCSANRRILLIKLSLTGRVDCTMHLLLLLLMDGVPLLLYDIIVES